MEILWNAEVAFEGNIPDYIDGLAFGDADSSRDGNEIVCVPSLTEITMPVVVP